MLRGFGDWPRVGFLYGDRPVADKATALGRCGNKQTLSP